MLDASVTTACDAPRFDTFKLDALAAPRFGATSVLLLNVSMVARPTSVSVAVGSVRVAPPLIIVAITG